jgi:filamentous hemagglutinin
LVDGLLDDAAKQAGKVDDLLTDGFGNLQGTAAGLGAAADDLFKPYFESSSSSPALEGNPYHPDIVEQRIRPPYHANPAHDPHSQFFNLKKTVEPQDANQVYEKSVRAKMGTWFGINQNGEIYRFFSDNAGGVHFSGIVSPQRVPSDALKQLKRK